MQLQETPDHVLFATPLRECERCGYVGELEADEPCCRADDVDTRPYQPEGWVLCLACGYVGELAVGVDACCDDVPVVCTTCDGAGTIDVDARDGCNGWKTVACPDCPPLTDN
ncbi:hypothetical protein [Candidatus Poriferisodalis sp.]|uniref:hypothetical protein n=1 Tax=Candidatus Poriferisodalis sp. TaxID=3101277 RepID=UPI003B01C018